MTLDLFVVILPFEASYVVEISKYTQNVATRSIGDECKCCNLLQPY